MRTTARLLLILALAAPAVVVGSGATAADPQKRDLPPAVAIRAQAELDAVRNAIPEDLIGIDRVLRKYGQKPMTVKVNGIGRALSATEATQIISQRNNALGEFGTLSVPPDAFTVAVSIYGSFIPAGGRIISGSWNFRDNYVNGSDPDDVAGIEVNLQGCYQVAAGVPTMHTYTWNGVNYDHLLWLQNSGVSNGSVAIGINDSVIGFAMKTDHGSLSVQYNPINPGCQYHQIGGAFDYEHNQDGGGSWSLSIGWGLFAVNYQNPGSKLLKSSGAAYY